MWKSYFRELCKAFQAFLFQMEQTVSGKYLHDASCSHETGWKHPNMRAHLSTAKEVWLESMLPCQEKEPPRVTNCLATHSLKALHQSNPKKKYIYIYGPASLGTPPHHPMVMGLHSSAPVPSPPLWCGWCGWWWVVVEEVVYVCIWMYMYGMNVYF